MNKQVLSKILNGENVRQVLTEAPYSKYKAKYIVSSERSNRRSDEDHVELYSDKILDVGDSFEMDGLTWYVDEVVSDPDRGIHETKKVKGTGKKINYEDDLVVVYDKDGNVVYKGVEDSEGMKDEPWKWDDSIGAYRLDDFIKTCVG